jgi:hypothetical protein
VGIEAKLTGLVHPCSNRKLARRTLICGDEMMMLLACFKKCNFEDAKCMGEKKALDACLAFQARQPKSSNTINHHLQRLSRLAKR